MKKIKEINIECELMVLQDGKYVHCEEKPCLDVDVLLEFVLKAKRKKEASK